MAQFNWRLSVNQRVLLVRLFAEGKLSRLGAGYSSRTMQSLLRRRFARLDYRKGGWFYPTGIGGQALMLDDCNRSARALASR